MAESCMLANHASPGATYLTLLLSRWIFRGRLGDLLFEHPQCCVIRKASEDKGPACEPIEHVCKDRHVCMTIEGRLRSML
jgi:hypothetical protein